MSINFEEFKNQAKKILNINFDGYKLKRVERRTESLMRRHNVEDFEECIHLLKTNEEFKAAYLNHFTINTSEFFRNANNYEYLQKKILPKLFNKNKKLKIWSAPCSNGCEPYTIAIIMEEMGIHSNQYEILASDLDKNIIAEAKEGIYGMSSLKNVSSDLLKKYFKPVSTEGQKYQLSKKIINQVKFEYKDLIKDKYSTDWDLILSRNFFIYLTREIKSELTQKFSDSINSGGYFFLGSTEFIFNPEQYGLKKEHLSFYEKQ